VAYEAIRDTLDFGIPEVQDLFACGASTEPDTMYYHEAMKEPDREKFLKAMEQK
jgi:hypothetical protein